MWAELYDFLKEKKFHFVKVNYVVYLFIQFMKWTGERGIFLDQSASKIELAGNPLI